MFHRGSWMGNRFLISLCRAWRWIVQVLGNALYRFYWDDCFSRASSLAYTSLFALVPVTALSFSLFGVFGVDQVHVREFLETVLRQVLPPSANPQLDELQRQLFDNLSMFSRNAAALNTLSIGVLVFTCVALVNTIESALNVVWRVTSNLSMLSKIMSFWSVITFGPLFIAISIYWYAQMTVFAQSDPEVFSRIWTVVNVVVPVAATWLALTGLFFKLPAARVRLVDAAFGAIVAAVLFEFVKRGFAYYVGLSTTYSTVYGVLASIPLFLFWLYVAWVIVLLGAEISYQSGSIHLLSGRRKYATDLGEVGALLGLRILYSIVKRFVAGRAAPSESELAIETGSDPVLVRTCLDILSQAKILSSVDPDTHARSLIVSPSRLTVADVLHTFRSKQGRAQPIMVVPGESEFGIEAFGRADLPSNVDSNEADCGDIFFLEFLKRKGQSPDAARPLSAWTLEEFVKDQPVQAT